MDSCIRRDRTGRLSNSNELFDFTQNAFIPQQLVYGASLQYSMPYLKSEVIDLQLPEFFNHLIPIVEASFTTPVANNFGNPYTTTERSILA